jgi:hypothetical protein
MYTYCVAKPVSRVDRIYLTRYVGKPSSTHRLSVVLKITLDAQRIQRGRCFGELNTATLEDEETKNQNRMEYMETGTTSIHRRNNMAGPLHKGTNTAFLHNEGYSKYRDDKINEKLYCSCIYDLLNEQNDIRGWSTKIKVF